MKTGGALIVKGPADQPCFLTGATEDVFQCRFADGSQMPLSWPSVLDVLKRRLQEGATQDVSHWKAGQGPARKDS